MKTKLLALLLSITLVTSLLASRTVAFLTSTDAKVNVMTIGNVYIEQIEEELDASNNLVVFQQEKPLYPAHYEDGAMLIAEGTEGGEANGIPMGGYVSGHEGEAAWQIYAENPEVVDKFVRVENTGKSDAYVRTILAFERSTHEKGRDYIHLNYNEIAGEMKWEWTENLNLGGVMFDVAVVTYLKPLAKGEFTLPSLKQLYMDKRADNAYYDAFGDLYEIKALSQAVQADGFDGAEAALNTAFGELTVSALVTLLSDLKYEGSVESGRIIPVTSGQQLLATVEAVKNGTEPAGSVIRIDAAFTLSRALEIPVGVQVSIDTNGHTLAVGTATAQLRLFSAAIANDLIDKHAIENSGTLQLIGGGVYGILNRGVLTLQSGTYQSAAGDSIAVLNEGGKLTVLKDAEVVNDKDGDVSAAIYSTGGSVSVSGGEVKGSNGSSAIYAASGTVSLTGGAQVSAQDSSSAAAIVKGSNANVGIYDANVSGGSAPVTNENGDQIDVDDLKVDAVQIGSVEALEAFLAKGGKGVLTSDISFVYSSARKMLKVPAGVTAELVLGGHTLQASNGCDYLIENKGVLTISGAGTLRNGSGAKAMLYNAAGAYATVNDAAAYCEGGANSALFENHGTLTISGGTQFISSGYASVYKNVKGTMTLSVVNTSGSPLYVIEAKGGTVSVKGTMQQIRSTAMQNQHFAWAGKNASIAFKPGSYTYNNCWGGKELGGTTGNIRFESGASITVIGAATSKPTPKPTPTPTTEVTPKPTEAPTPKPTDNSSLENPLTINNVDELKSLFENGGYGVLNFSPNGMNLHDTLIVPEGKQVHLNCKAKTFYSTATNAVIHNKGTLTLVNFYSGHFTGSGDRAETIFLNEGTLYMENSTVTAMNASAPSIIVNQGGTSSFVGGRFDIHGNSGRYAFISNGGRMDIEDVTIYPEKAKGIFSATGNAQMNISAIETSESANIIAYTEAGSVININSVIGKGLQFRGDAANAFEGSGTVNLNNGVTITTIQ